MPLKQTQDKAGHRRGVSTNDVKKTGRPDGTGLGQKKAGHGATYEKSTNSTDRKRPSAEAVGVRGYPRNERGSGPSTKRGNDGFNLKKFTP